MHCISRIALSEDAGAALRDSDLAVLMRRIDHVFELSEWMFLENATAIMAKPGSRGFGDGWFSRRAVAANP